MRCRKRTGASVESQNRKVETGNWRDDALLEVVASGGDGKAEQALPGKAVSAALRGINNQGFNGSTERSLRRCGREKQSRVTVFASAEIADRETPGIRDRGFGDGLGRLGAALSQVVLGDGREACSLSSGMIRQGRSWKSWLRQGPRQRVANGPLRWFERA
jgi:hypothetical protein